MFRAESFKPVSFRPVSWAGLGLVVGGGIPRKRRRRIVVEIDGRALWFETLEEAQAAVDALPLPALPDAKPPRVRVKLKPAIKGPQEAPETAPSAPVEASIDLAPLMAWAEEWNRAARAQAEQVIRLQMLRAMQDEDDDEEALLMAL